MAKPKIGIVLSGCGYLDGAEIHESVLTMLAVDKKGGEMVMISADIEQKHVVDHSTSSEVRGEKRHVMTESARIARGAVMSIANVNAGDLDALIFPGGFGVAKNLSDFAFEGTDMEVLPEVEKLIKEMNDAGKPVGFVCIAPVVAAKVLGDGKLKLTIGSDPSTAQAIEAMGGVHVNCDTVDCIVDSEHKVVSTPAYMLGPNITAVFEGISKLVDAVFGLI
jgi:enhancing lycopene biosynthesis protein 2